MVTSVGNAWVYSHERDIQGVERARQPCLTNLDFGAVERGYGDSVVGHPGEGRDVVVRDEQNIVL